MRRTVTITIEGDDGDENAKFKVQTRPEIEGTGDEMRAILDNSGALKLAWSIIEQIQSDYWRLPEKGEG